MMEKLISWMRGAKAKEQKRQQEIESADPASQLAIQTKRIQTVQKEVEEALNNIEKKAASIHEEVLKGRFLVMTLNEQIKIAVSNQQDDVARDLIQEKQKQQDRLDQLETSLSLAQKNQDKVQKMLDILVVGDISQWDKQWDIGILNEVARAQKVVTDLYQSMGIQSHYKN